jgi:hypothetical protein
MPDLTEPFSSKSDVTRDAFQNTRSCKVMKPACISRAGAGILSATYPPE